VWNEPNIDFWNGIPRQKSYFELYEHTARDLKKVSERLRVGGPATAAAAWVDDFLKFAATNHVPVDFISSHGYADDTVEDLFGTNENIPMDDRVCRAIGKVKKQIQTSQMPNLPLFWTEWNVQGMNGSRDTAFVGTGLANTIRECDGLVDMMSFWTFSDVFEEGGPIAEPFEGQFGLRAKGGINKPSFYDFALLHQLGDQRIANASPDVLVTKRKDGTLAVAVWNIVDPGTKGTAKDIQLTFRDVPENAKVSISRVDDEHGNTLAAYKAMGSPVDPSDKQVGQLNQETAPGAPEQRTLSNGKINLTLGENALFLLKIGTPSVE
jgi:xylan 1,4-beta-xylosidase